jgi:Rieske Fe-S protein
MPDISRRHVLGAGALGIGVVAVAACGTSGSKSGSAAGGAEKSAAPSGPTGVIKLADVPVGGCARAKVHGQPVMVSQKTAGVVTAFSAICTHMGCTVNPAGTEFHCPCHGSKYDAFTGAVIQGPAPRALPSIAVDVVGGEVTTT